MNLKPDDLSAPYRIISTEMYNNLVILITGLSSILRAHENDNKQLDTYEYNWLKTKLKAIIDLKEDFK